MRAPTKLWALSAVLLIGGWTAPAAASPALDPDFAAVDAAPWKRHYARALGKRTVFVGDVTAPDDFPGTAADLRKALKKSLSAFELASAPRNRAEYVLSASVFEFAVNDVPRAKSTTAQIGIDYAVVDAQSGAPLFEQAIRTQFTARAPRKHAATDMKEALAETRSKRELLARLAAQEQKADPKDFLKVKCAAKDEARGAVGDGELSSEARTACAQNHAVHANLEAFFARLLVYRPSPLQASNDAPRAGRSPKRAQR